MQVGPGIDIALTRAFNQSLGVYSSIEHFNNNFHKLLGPLEFDKCSFRRL